MKRGLLLGVVTSGILLLTPMARAVTTNVTMSNFTFTPNTANISVGDTVRWNNNSGNLHDSTRSSPPMTWASGDVSGSGGMFSVTFNSAGTFPYVCNRHLASFGMMGSVVVAAAANTPPTVSITNPANSAVFTAPASVTIQATASDNGSVTNVQFLVGTAVVGNDTTLPYLASTNGLPFGTYTVSAVASDNLGATATNSISIIVNAAPSVSLTNPVNNAKFRAPASFQLQASATDSDGSVTNVQFFSGGSPVGNDTNPPFSFNMNNLAAGNYSFSAVAADNRGMTTTSAANNVSVLTNAILSAPTRLPSGQFQFTVIGIAGQTYATEGSANLTNWSSIVTNVAPANTFNVTDFTSTNVLLRYYRARQDL
jgi:plastocyanin